MRITVKHLEAKVVVVNALLGHTDPQWNTVGSVKLYSAYGATAVHRVVNTSGGCTVLSELTTMREISRFLDGLITGLRVSAEVTA